VIARGHYGIPKDRLTYEQYNLPGRLHGTRKPKNRCDVVLLSAITRL